MHERMIIGEETNEEYPKIKYKVFCGNNEEEVKLLAVSHITTSIQYEEELIERPNISMSVYIKGLILPLMLNLVTTVFTLLFYKSIGICLFIVVYFIVFMCFVKYSIILFVLLYQKFAPKEMRCSCCFEPSCSNYMLQAIDKHGFVKGFVKGVYRLCRCHYPNGGIDNP